MEIDDFGGCPTCGKNDGYLNVGRTQIFVCHPHRAWWIVGCNLFSSWQGETQADFDRNRKLLETYKEVEAIWYSTDLWPWPLAGIAQAVRRARWAVWSAVGRFRFRRWYGRLIAGALTEAEIEEEIPF
jgi:hypothetical protein